MSSPPFASAPAASDVAPPPTSLDAARIPRRDAGVSFGTSLIYALALTSITVGILWDISWHISIGRDTFWTPAHMAVYFGGVLAGLTSGWLAIWYTFLAGPEERGASVGILGFRAPLGAWACMWGAVAMLTSAPFDDWWHNAYGLDVRILSPPHTLLGLGMFGISLGALLVGLSHQNRTLTRRGAWLFIYIGGVFVVLGGIIVMEVTFPNLQHSALFYEVCAVVYVLRMVTLGVAGRISWPATRTALVFLAIQCLATWLLPLFPAHPKLAPIFNPVTHMVPPAFPVLLIFPAVAFDLILARTGVEMITWKRALLGLVLGAAFVAAFIPAQWYFAEFLLTPRADNWFFAGNRYWGYQEHLGPWKNKFHRLVPGRDDFSPLTPAAVAGTWLIASGAAWLGLLWGGWMRKVQR